MFKISILAVAFLLIGNAKTWARDLAPNLEDHQEVQEGNYTQTCDNSHLPIATPIYFLDLQVEYISLFIIPNIILGLDEEESLHSFGDYNIHGEILEQVGVEGDNLEDLTNQQVTYK